MIFEREKKENMTPSFRHQTLNWNFSVFSVKWPYADQIFTCPIPSQFARSLALARAVDNPTMRHFLVVWFEMKLVRETITSNTGPLSAPNKWISSMTNSTTSFTYFLVCQLRLTPSHFSGVVTMTSAETIARISGVTSPVNSTTLQRETTRKFSQ